MLFNPRDVKNIACVIVGTTLGVSYPLSLHANEGEWIKSQQSSLQAQLSGNTDLALSEGKKTVQIAEASFGASHMKTALSYKRLAEIYRQANDLENAALYLNKTSDSWIKLLGPQDYLITQLMEEKFELLATLGRNPEAIDVLLKMIQRDIEMFGEFHTTVARDKERASDFFWMQDSKVKALEFSIQALEIYSRTTNQTDIRYIRRLQKTAEFLSQLGQSEKATELWYQHAVAVTAFHHEKAHFASALAWIQAGDAYVANRNDLKANECAIKAQ